MDQKNISIIIPAHNEEASINRCLSALTRPNSDYKVQIIVVCNGCHDKTADLVNAFDSTITCLETEVASKSHALNLGDEVATFYPRIYLDADVILTIEAVNALCLTLTDEKFLATSSCIKMDLDSSSWFVRAFYEVWLNLPYCKAGMIGSGVYALSKKGRERFQKFPDIIADDGYVRCLFTESERPLTVDCYSTVTAPHDLMSLIKITTRSRVGCYELREKFPDLISNEAKNYQTALIDFLLNFKQWPKIMVYVGINIITRVRAKYQIIRKITVWERDDSSRS
ncbi:MAG: glycosyltransferase [Methylococcales bacterium]|nr:glycosyltransferase [Methylococcales bacterium]